MSLRGPLRGHAVLVLGAGDKAGQAVALHLSALGAALLLAGPDIGAVVTTAGLIAAAGGTVRVVEVECPPLPVPDAYRLASEALEPPTDVVVSTGAFESAAAAKKAHETLRARLPAGAVAVLLDAVPVGRERTEAERVAALFTGAADASPENGSRPARA